jgi:hypothetical protein
VAKARLSGAEPKIRDVKPDTDPVLADICDQALAVNPDQRFSSAAEFQVALQKQLNQLGAHGRSALVEMLDKAFSVDRHDVRKRIEKRLLTDSGEVRALVAGPQSSSVELSLSPKIAPRSPRRLFVPAAVFLVIALAVGVSTRWFLGRSKGAAAALLFDSSSATAPRAVVAPLPASALPPVVEEQKSVPPQTPVAPVAEVQPSVENARPATVYKALSGHRGSRFTMAATEARQSARSSAGVMAPSAAGTETPARRGATKREASLSEPQGAVTPGTHLVRPAGRYVRGSIDEKDPYSP